MKRWRFLLIRLVSVIMRLNQFRGCSKGVQSENVMSYATL